MAQIMAEIPERVDLESIKRFLAKEYRTKTRVRAVGPITIARETTVVMNTEFNETAKLREGAQGYFVIFDDEGVEWETKPGFESRYEEVQK